MPSQTRAWLAPDRANCPPSASGDLQTLPLRRLTRARVGVKAQGNTLSRCVPETNESEPTDDASGRLPGERIELAGGNSHQRLDMSQDG